MSIIDSFYSFYVNYFLLPRSTESPWRDIDMVEKICYCGIWQPATANRREDAWQFRSILQKKDGLSR